jgi:UDP-N-acetyl-D-mannosaminuronate dehydrogenase
MTLPITPHIAIIGLGYVGLPLAVEFGKKYPVTGFDIKQSRIDELNPASGDTWSGRGRVPRWLAAELSNGRKREEFLMG